MEDSLIKIARRFNAADITWALGASMLLHYKGLVLKPNDIDLVIALEDITCAQRILDELGVRKPLDFNANYATRYFAEYVIGGVDVDVMAGFRIITDETTVEYILNPKTFGTLNLKGTTIKLCPLEDWYVLYLLMPERGERVAAIKGYFLENGANREYLKAWAERDLPPVVTEQIRELSSKETI